jgi:hypothetical protein
LLLRIVATAQKRKATSNENMEMIEMIFTVVLFMLLF